MVRNKINKLKDKYDFIQAERDYYLGKISSFTYKPLLSIIMPVYNVNPDFLKRAIQSVQDQVYENWELCLVDDKSTYKRTLDYLEELKNHSDKRIKLEFRKENGGISKASNDAIKLAKGEFIVLMDNDDAITYDALYQNVLILNSNKNLDYVYSDEDRIDVEDKKLSVFHKVDFDKFWLLSNMYTCHLSLYRTKIVKEVGGFRPECDGSQDYDLLLRVIQKTDKIYHIPKVLYHWRAAPGSTSLAYENKPWSAKAQEKALKDYFEDTKLRAEIYKTPINGIVGYNIKAPASPKVSIIILTKNRYNYLKTCIESIEERSTYKNYEIIIVNHESDEEELLDYLSNTKHKVIEYKGKFNFSKMNNTAARQAEGEYLLFLNNDTKVITPEFLENMVGFAQLKEVGAVGAKLLYENKTIQHAGIGCYDIGPGNLFTGSNVLDVGPYGILTLNRTVLAVSGACLFISKKKFQEVKMFDEEFDNDYNDVDICLKLYEKGYKNVLLGNTILFHFESISRGKNKENFDVNAYQKYIKKWTNYINNDPYSNFIKILNKEGEIQQSGVIRIAKKLIPQGKTRKFLVKIYRKLLKR